MDAKHLPLDVVAHAQNHRLGFRRKLERAQNLGDMSPCDSQLTGEIRSRGSFTGL